MEILENIEIIDLTLFFKKEKILVFTDTHLGYEEALNKKGVLIPKFHFKDLMKKLEKILKKTNPKKIILLGDMKHEFGKISDDEWRDAKKLIDFLKKNSDELILIKGNHDKIIEPIAKKFGLEVKTKYLSKNSFFCHGDFIPEELKSKDYLKDIENIFIGHEHPAITLNDGVRTEKFKCFLKGTWENKNLIVLPSFNLLTTGTDVLTGKLLSPFLKQDLKPFEAYVVSEKIYNFGKLINL